MSLRRGMSEGEEGTRPRKPLPTPRKSATGQWKIQVTAYHREGAERDLGLVTVKWYGDHIERTQHSLQSAGSNPEGWTLGFVVVQRGRMPSEEELLQIFKDG